MTSQWGAGPVLAWTDRDGPGRAPAGPMSIQVTALGATGAAVGLAMWNAAMLCPVHQMWVHNVAFAALVMGIGAVVAMVRRRPVAGVLTLGSALAGLAVSLVGVIHLLTDGWMVSLGLAGVAVLAGVLALGRSRATRRDRAAATAMFAPPDLTAQTAPERAYAPVGSDAVRI